MYRKFTRRKQTGIIVKTHAVYEIECLTPNHYYVGMSGQVEKRLGNHLLGRGSKFTQRHGVKSARIIGWFESEADAKLAEQTHYRYIRDLGFTIRM
jgi:predicted GIY-YIG superfamily endonuclease